MLAQTTVLRGSRPTSNAPGTPAIHVAPIANQSYRVAVGQHFLTIDQPASAGGDDLGPTPVQLFVASLAACVAHYAGSYLARHDLSSDGLAVEADYAMAEDTPARIASVSISITPPAGLPANRQAALLAVASHCTLHNTLREAPPVDISLSSEHRAAAA